MQVKATSSKRDRAESYFGVIFSVAFIGAYFVLGISAAIKVLGAACVVTGLVWMFGRSIPVGIEGRPPSFHLGGWAAVLAGLAMVAMGVGMLVYSQLAGCVLGWIPDGECF